jgi:hypothetical protein
VQYAVNPSYAFTRDTESRYAKNQRRYRQKSFEFIAIDGEGAGYGKEHRYVLLGCGPEYIENLEGIGWKEAFEFLYSVFRRKPSASFVGFFLGYDFTQILKTLPEERARMLLTDGGINARKRVRSGGNRKPFPVRHSGWEFDLLPGRRLQIRPLNCNCHEDRMRKCEHEQPEWMYICDSGAFWQCSLLNAINPKNWQEPVCTQEEYDKLEYGKSQRSMTLEEYIADRERVLEYMLLENRIFERIMDRLRDGFIEIGVNLRKDQWYGPGQAAAAYYKKEKIPRREQLENVIPAEFWESARQSYFGGWFEIFSHGIVPGSSYEYDINSAYPFIIASLPCLLHGRYSVGIGSPPDEGRNSAFTLVYARVTGSDPNIGALLNRDKDGRIRRPRITEGWYWLHEIKAAVRAGLVSDTDIREWRSYHPCDCPSPVRGFRDLYEHRLEVGKDTVLGKSCKLVYNSGYGKFAQSVGQAPYGNWVYASLITAGCRSMILDAIASHPGGTGSVLMVATDGVFFDSIHPSLPISKKLGEWDYSRRENLTLFKPGVYWDDKARMAISKGDAVGFKARGINARDFARNLGRIDALFLRAIDFPPEFKVKLYESEEFTAYAEKEWPWIAFPVGFSLTSVKTALMRNDWSQAGQTQVDIMVIQDSDPSDKREGVYYDGAANRLRTKPVDVPDGEIVSVPYEKRYGMDDPFSQESREEFGITWDGVMSDAVREYINILKGEL